MSEEGTPASPRKGPYVLQMEPGTYWWCACGRSAKQPFCDGAHKSGPFKPVKVELAEKQRVAWCGCKRTATQPYCDGTHKK